MKLKQTIRVWHALRSIPLVLSSGMPRSGSTLVYNSILSILIFKHGRVRGGFVNDVSWRSEIQNERLIVLKSHDVKQFGLHLRASKVIYTFRDPRVALLSQHRKFGTPLTINHFERTVATMLDAEGIRCLKLKYEDFIADDMSMIEQLSEYFGMPNLTPSDLTEIQAHRNAQMEQPTDTRFKGMNINSISLQHENHRTFTSNIEWKTEFPTKLIHEINARYSGTLQKYGYEVEE